MIGYKEMSVLKSDVIDLLNLADGYDEKGMTVMAEQARDEALQLMVKYAHEKIGNGDNLNGNDNAIAQMTIAGNQKSREYWQAKTEI